MQARATTINVVTEVFPDFQYVDENGNLLGFAAELVRQVLDDTKIDYDISVQNWSVAYNAALRTPNTCLFSVARLPTRENQFLWAFPVGEFTTSFYGLKSSGIKLDKLEDAKKYKTAVIRNNYSHLYLLENGFNEDEHMIMISSFDKVFELIATRKNSLDLVILSDAQYRFKEKNGTVPDPLERLFTIQQHTSELYFVCNKNTDKNLFEKIKSSFTKLKSNKN